MCVGYFFPRHFVNKGQFDKEVTQIRHDLLRAVALFVEEGLDTRASKPFERRALTEQTIVSEKLNLTLRTRLMCDGCVCVYLLNKVEQPAKQSNVHFKSGKVVVALLENVHNLKFPNCTS